MAGIYSQKGPRAHHFVSSVSLAIGISVFFEYYASNVVFATLNGVTPVSGQHLWGLIFLFLGLLLMQPFSIILRAINLVVLCFVWTVFGLYSMYVSVIGPQAEDVGSAFGILSLAMAVTCILATSNLKRDFYETDRRWLKNNPLERIVDPFRPKGGDSYRE